MVCNSGHFDVELDLPALKDRAATHHRRTCGTSVDEYKLKNGQRIYVIGQGRLVNLAAAEGHPPSVMDMSFATQALATEFCVKNKGKLPQQGASPCRSRSSSTSPRTSWQSMGISIDR